MTDKARDVTLSHIRSDALGTSYSAEESKQLRFSPWPQGAPSLISLRKAYLADFLENLFSYSKYKLICRVFFVLVYLDFSWDLMPRTSDWKKETEKDLSHLYSKFIFFPCLFHI